MSSNQFHYLETRALSFSIPANYTVPSFPSLYWPFPFDYDKNVQARYLYTPKEVVRFTLLWTLVFVAAVHLAAACYTAFRMRRAWKILWIVPVFYGVIAGVQACLVGSICGALLGIIYKTADAAVSTWIPCVWGLVIGLIIILKLFEIEGVTF